MPDTLTRISRYRVYLRVMDDLLKSENSSPLAMNQYREMRDAANTALTELVCEQLFGPLKFDEVIACADAETAAKNFKCLGRAASNERGTETHA